MIWKSILAGVVLSVLAGSVVYFGLGGELSEDLYTTETVSTSGKVETEETKTAEIDAPEIEGKVLPSETPRAVEMDEAVSLEAERTDRLPITEQGSDAEKLIDSEYVDAEAAEIEAEAEEKPNSDATERTTRQKLGDLIGRKLD